MNTSLYDSGAYRRSRVAYIVQCSLEYIVQLLVLDTFLAKLLTSLGVADAAVGVISSVLSFTCLIQLVSVPLLRNMRSVKRVVILTDCASMLLYVGLYLLPAMGLGSRAGTVMALVLVAGGSLLRSFSFSVYYQWAISFVDPAKRGKFTAKKEMVSLATAIVMTLAAGAAGPNIASVKFVDAEGETWFSCGQGGVGCNSYDWPFLMSMGYDGWNFLQAPLTGKSDVKITGPGENQWLWTRDGSGNSRIDWPVKVTAIGVSQYGRTLDLLDMKASSPSIRLKGLSVR